MTPSRKSQKCTGATIESEKLRLTVLELQGKCSREQGISQCDFEELYISCKLWRKLIQTIRKSTYDAIDQAEMIEKAELVHADTTLLLVENAHHRKCTPPDFDADNSCSSAYNFFEQFLRKKEAQYSDQGRENLNHKDIIDAEREFIIANLRIGLWEKDSDKVNDAVESLQDILAKYEAMELDIRHQDTRNTAYRLQEGLSFLIDHAARHYETDLYLITERYELTDDQNSEPYEWPHRHGSAITQQAQTRSVRFFGDLKSVLLAISK